MIIQLLVVLLWPGQGKWRPSIFCSNFQHGKYKIGVLCVVYCVLGKAVSKQIKISLFVNKS